jgi:hypothetical protein
MNMIYIIYMFFYENVKYYNKKDIITSYYKFL